MVRYPYIRRYPDIRQSKSLARLGNIIGFPFPLRHKVAVLLLHTAALFGDPYCILLYPTVSHAEYWCLVSIRKAACGSNEMI